jgi:NADPH:quinone reductase-like Zn-dependent oxidoreductase
MARIRKKDRVLIQNAGGGVGIAAIQIALQAGAEPVGLVSTQAKMDALKPLGISELYTYEQWEQFENTRAKNFEVILDSAGGSSLKQNFKHLAPGGRLISYGASNLVKGKKRSLLKVLSHLMSTPFLTPYGLMMGNHGIFGLNLLKLFQESASEKPELLKMAFDQIIDSFNQGKYKVWIGKTFPLSQAAAAHSYLQSRSNIGKVILIPPNSRT